MLSENTNNNILCVLSIILSGFKKISSFSVFQMFVIHYEVTPRKTHSFILCALLRTPSAHTTQIPAGTKNYNNLFLKYFKKLKENNFHFLVVAKQSNIICGIIMPSPPASSPHTPTAIQLLFALIAKSQLKGAHWKL